MISSRLGQLYKADELSNFCPTKAASRPGPELAVRINPPSGDRSLSNDDLDIILPSQQLEVILLLMSTLREMKPMC